MNERIFRTQFGRSLLVLLCIVVVLLIRKASMKIFRYAVVISGVLAASLSNAQPLPKDFKLAPPEDTAKISSIFVTQLKSVPEQIFITDIPGIYEVHLSKKVVYVSSDGKFLIDGSMIRTDGVTNLTADRVARLHTVDTSALPLKDAIKTVQGKGSRTIYTFEDPRCGFCKQLRSDLKKLNDVTIYTFQVSVLGPESVVKANEVWCSKDRSAAWDSVMSGKNIETVGACDVSAMERNGKLFSALRMTGTPTLVFKNGDRIGGAVGAAEIEKKL